MHRLWLFGRSFAGGEASDAKASRASDKCGSEGGAQGFVDFEAQNRSR